MIITNIKRNKNLYLIYLDGEYSFTIYDETMYKLNLKIGDEFIPNEEIIMLLEEDEVIRCKNRAFYILSYASRTEKVLRKKLQEDSFGEYSIDETIKYLKENDYLNDFQLALDIINIEIEKKKSKNEIKNKLYQRGISSQTISEVFSEIYIDEFENALYIAKKKYSAISHLSIYDIMKKIRYTLNYKKFSYDAISYAIDEIKVIHYEGENDEEI